MMIGRSGWSNLCTTFQKTSTKERVKKITFVKRGQGPSSRLSSIDFSPSLDEEPKKKRQQMVEFTEFIITKSFRFKSMITEIWHDIEKVFILELFLLSSERSLRLTV